MGRISKSTFGGCRGGSTAGALNRAGTEGLHPEVRRRQRPLGIAALEDKILQRAVVEVLNGIYEADFVGFSYGAGVVSDGAAPGCGSVGGGGSVVVRGVVVVGTVVVSVAGGGCSSVEVPCSWSWSCS
jgi:hypothetical protein